MKYNALHFYSLTSIPNMICVNINAFTRTHTKITRQVDKSVLSYYTIRSFKHSHPRGLFNSIKSSVFRKAPL